MTTSAQLVSPDRIKILTVVGARPNFMKAAPILAAMEDYNRGVRQSAQNGDFPVLIQSVLVHTGQHYDQQMSGTFFADLSIPAPDVHLDVGPGSHAAQTAGIIRGFETVLLRERPDVVVVVGDVNSTIACALVASKISGDGWRPKVVHVEAGLRSFDRTMPEEINRILTDQLSDLLFVTEESGVRNLQREGFPEEKIHFVGNTMIDSLLAHKDRADQTCILESLGLRDDSSARPVLPYALLTLHRPANVDSSETFLEILSGLQELARDYPVIFPAHPRTIKRIHELGLQRFFVFASLSEPKDLEEVPRRAFGLKVIEPLGYLEFLCLMKNAAIVVTDSGGIQEETTCLGVRCATVRENTERPVTVTCGTNVLAGVSSEGIRRTIREHLALPPRASTPEKWDGKSAGRIVRTITDACLPERVENRLSA